MDQELFLENNTSSPIVNATGNYTVTVTDPTNGCTSTTTVAVTNNSVQPNLATSATVTLTCTTTSGSISASSTTPGVSYNWSGTGIVSGNTTPSPTINTAGTYTVIITDLSNGFTNSAIVVVNNNITPPNVTAGSYLLLTCTTTSSTINANSTITGACYNWAGAGIVSGGNTSSPTVNVSGTYTVTVTDPANGCTSTTTVNVTVAPPPLATVNANAVVINLGANTTLVASGGASYSWSPAIGLSCTNCSSPIASPSETTTYCVVVKDQYGCSDSTCVKVNVYDPCSASKNGLFIPNVFSPNGDDQNDLFFIKDWNNECVVEFSIEIYDRWGLKMFVSDGANVQWDGRTASGLESPAGTYYYIVRYKKLRAEAQTHKGFLNLVR